MKLRSTRLILALIAVIVLGLASISVALYRQAKDKAEWSILQGIEFGERQSIDVSKIVFASSQGYDAVGIKAGSLPSTYPVPKTPRVWLLIGARYGQLVKKIPTEAKYTITSSDLDVILKRFPNISSATRDELRQHAVME